MSEAFESLLPPLCICTQHRGKHTYPELSPFYGTPLTPHPSGPFANATPCRKDVLLPVEEPSSLSRTDRILLLTWLCLVTAIDGKFPEGRVRRVLFLIITSTIAPGTVQGLYYGIWPEPGVGRDGGGGRGVNTYLPDSEAPCTVPSARPHPRSGPWLVPSHRASAQQCWL